MREVVLDTETTGLDPLNGDRIVELGCLELLNHIPSGRHWHCYLNPECAVSPEAFAVHGLSTDFLKDKPSFANVVDEFLAFVDEAPMIIHNAPFDMGFLNAELTRLNRAMLPMERAVDTLALARRKHPGAPNSLDALCKRYRVDARRRSKHGALVDCELLAIVYGELLGQRQAHLELTAAIAGGALDDYGAIGSHLRPEPLPERLTADETAAHAAFVADLGNEALWRKFPSEG